MKQIENNCVDCGLPCLGDTCPHKYTAHLYCDRCNDDVDKLYKVNDEELCSECALDVLEVVGG